MKKLRLILFLLSICHSVSGQWVNLGIQGSDVQMIGNAQGYNFINTTGPTPATGITYEVKATQDDWQNAVTTNNGGGGNYGCCAISNLHFMNISTGIRSVGNQGIYSFQKTTDNGVTWSAFASAINFDPKEIVMVNDTTGYIAGNSYGTNHGQLYKLTPTASVQLFDWDTLWFGDAKIEFLNPRNGFIIMTDHFQDSHLFRSNDAGASWTRIFSSDTIGISSASFPDSLRGYLCRYNGGIHKTTDGGANWLPIQNPSTYAMRSVDFFDANVGYIAGDSGLIYKTVDGALSWSFEPSGVISHLDCIQMLDLHTAYCIGSDGVLLKNGPSLSAEELPGNSFESTIVYPNPASKLISIILPEGLVVKAVELFDVHGRLVLSGNQDEVDVASLSSGMYWVKVLANGRSYTTRFIKD